MMIREFSRQDYNLIFSWGKKLFARRSCLSLIAIFLLSAGLVGLFRQPANLAFGSDPNAVPAKTTLVIGKVSNNPRKHYGYLKPMVDYAVTQMKDLGIRDGAVLMARDNAQMVELLKQGKVDWVTETAFSALLFEHHHAAEILLRKWKKDASQYYTIFFARKDRAINSISDLKGKVIALEDPGSTTAFFEPLVCLFENNLAVQKLDSFKERPSPDKVGYVLSRQEINSSVWVYKELVDAAAFNNQDWNKSDHLYKNMRGDLKVIYRSDPIPRAFELVRTDLDPRIKERLKAVLLKAHLDKNAQQALRRYQSTRQFDELNAASISTLKVMRRELSSYFEMVQ